jgi:competence protein ComEA
VGLLLLVGTTLPTLTGTGPAFSVDATVRAGGPNADTDGSAGARDRAARNPSESIAEGGKPNPTRRLDINRADANALQALPGIGPALARRIVAYREAHGPFRESGDLLRVPGIGAQRYAGLQGRIRIAEGP